MVRSFTCLLLFAIPAFAEQHSVDTAHHIKTDAKVYLEPMAGFGTDLAAALIKKHVPLIVVDDKSKADYIIEGSNEDVKPGLVKAILINPSPAEHALISVKKQGTGELVYAYSFNKFAAWHGPQSAAEACAKHLKENIEGH